MLQKGKCKMAMPTSDEIDAMRLAKAEGFAAGFEAGFGFCNYAHNLGGDPPETAEEKAELAQQEADREAYKAALCTIGRSPRLPLGYPFTLDGLGFGKA
jgi:hypothetical protein